MKNLDVLGLDAKKTGAVVDGLNQLLADLHVYYMNLRGLHWNVKGRGFFQLHKEYEKLYDDTAEKIDEVAERILQLDGTPENRFSKLLKTAQLKEDGFEPTGHDGMLLVLDSLKVLIAQERKILDAAGKADDEVTTALMGDYLKEQEKVVWMIHSFLAKRPSDAK